jgi:DNA repair exonuclease SbcCD nuclease subunit
MPILFSADIHLKLGAKNIPVEWAKARYYGFFEKIHELTKDASLHIVGGDLFDRVPNLEELKLYFDFVKGCNVETIIYPGNHEATKKHRSFLTELKDVTNALNSLVTIVDEAYEDTRGFSILPYTDLHKKNSIEVLNSSIPLFTHVRGEIPPHVTPEVDLDRFSRFPVVFSGDLHSHNNCQRNIVYPGSPMTTSFHRSKVETGVIVIQDDWDWYFEKLDLPQLLRKTISPGDPMPQGVYDHVVYEIEGDMAALASVESSELLDKKVIKRAQEATLILSPTMSVAEELLEYLSFILELPEETIQEVMKVYNDLSGQITLG